MKAIDHKSLGARLDLFHFEEHSPGMIYWHPNGYKVFKAITTLIEEIMDRHNYQQVSTPMLLPRSLWEQSGHWQKFRNEMFTLQRNENDLALKPMSCPCHIQIFSKKRRSWRELPFRLSEFGNCHRDEPSGSLSGLLRSKMFTQDDAHVFCTEHQILEEVSKFIQMLKEIYSIFGFKSIETAIALRPDNKAGSDEIWDMAESTLFEAVKSNNLNAEIRPNEGAFYGPKLEFTLRDSLDRAWQCGTIQVDFVLGERMKARYIDQDSELRIPVILHHAILGSVSRFIAILLESNQGRLPFWIAPIQAVIIPVSKRQAEYAMKILHLINSAGISANILADATVGRRITEFKKQLIPLAIIVGEKEQEQFGVQLRNRHDSTVSLGLEAMIDMLKSNHHQRNNEIIFD